MPVSGTLPVLVSVNTWAGSKAQAKAGSGQFRVTVPKFRVVGVSVAAITGGGGGVAPNSTAPTSTALLVFLALPKKSEARRRRVRRG